MITYIFIIIIILLLISLYSSFVNPKRDPLLKAASLTKENKFLEAITEYKGILYNKPDAFEIHNKIADLYIKLNNNDQAIFHLNEIIRIGKFNTEVEKLDVVKKLAKSYYLKDDVEKAFQTYFEIIKINAEDAEAYYHISFISLGQEEFEIAQKYFEKLVKLEDSFEIFFGAGICSYQNLKMDDSISYFKEAISLKPNSDITILALAFALQKNRKYKEAISYLKKLADRVAEPGLEFISKRLLAFLHFQSGANDEGKDILRQLLDFVKSNNMTEEVLLTLFDLGYACIKNNLLEQAYDYWDDLYKINKEYNNIRESMNALRKEMGKTPGTKSDGFDFSVRDNIDDWETSSFPLNFLWNLCGLKSVKKIDMKNILVSTKVVKAAGGTKSEPVSKVDYDNRIDKFCGLDNENFRVISNRMILKLGFKVDEILNTYRESDGVDFLAYSADDNGKSLFWVRRWKESKVGEITLRNFAQAVNDIKAKKGILITTADLTPAAKRGLESQSKLQIIYPEQVNDLLKGLIKL